MVKLIDQQCVKLFKCAETLRNEQIMFEYIIRLCNKNIIKSE